MISAEGLMALKQKANRPALTSMDVGVEGWLNNDGESGSGATSKSKEHIKAEKEFGKVEELNDQAKSAYFRQKLRDVIARKNPAAFAEISKKWQELAKDPVTHTAQVRQRASWEVDKGQTKLTAEELKSALGDDYDEFMRLRSKYMDYNQGLSKNSEEAMTQFGFDDLAPTILGGTWEDKSAGLYYKPEYDGKEMYVDTNIPSLSHLVKKRKGKMSESIAKQTVTN